MTGRQVPTLILASSVAVYTAMVLGFAFVSYHVNERHLIYALDDAYIHMAMAKNLVESGVFGMTPYEFSSTSSSPLWTALLGAVYWVTGSSEWPPLALNYLCGLGAILVVWKFGYAAGLPQSQIGFLLAACVLLTPMVPLVFTGMEHLLHLVAVLVVAYLLWRHLVHEGPTRLVDSLRLGVSTAVAAGTRYESFFLVVAASLALLAKRRWLTIVICTGGALLPASGYGLFALAHEHHFLPTALLLKGNIPRVDGLEGLLRALGLDGLRQLFRNPHLYVLTLGLVFLFWRERARGGRWDGRSLMLAVGIAAIALHLQFAKTGWFYRYEAYLVGLSLVVISLQFRGPNDGVLLGLGQGAWATRASLSAVLLLLLFPLAARAAVAHFETVAATSNIYRQQYQMGRFLGRFYHDAPLAANDVGAINYLARIRCLDLWGLGSQEVAEQKRNGSYSTATIRKLTRDRNVHVAVVYRSWFEEERSLPEEWTIVETWTIPNNVVCGDDTVHFLATEPSEVPGLAENLAAFHADLPPEVVWKSFVSEK